LRKAHFWMFDARKGRQDIHDEHSSGRPTFDNIDAKVLVILET
jgi:hypothetical protein